MDPVLIEATGAVRPELRMEVSARGRLLLRQGREPVLVARVEPDRWGVAFHRTGPYRSPITAIPAATARAIAADPARWAYYFARQLTTSPDSPLYPARWRLTAPEHPGRWQALVIDGDRAGRIGWGLRDPWWQVLTLRRLADTDAGRVKAYRRLAREGTLPPLLVWHVSGLGCYLLLDGHDRLAAALAEDHRPALIALATAYPDDEVTARVARHLPDYLRDAQRQHGRPAERRIHEGFARLATAIGELGPPTRAWPISRAIWDAMPTPEWSTQWL